GLAASDPDAPPAEDAAELASARGCAAFHVLWPHLRELTFGDELDAADVDEQPLPSALGFALTAPGELSRTDWDDGATEGQTEARLALPVAAANGAGDDAGR